jgi:hypothetical protein
MWERKFMKYCDSSSNVLRWSSEEVVKTWVVNKAKWEAAKRVSDAKGWEFKILTEDDLFKKKP